MKKYDLAPSIFWVVATFLGASGCSSSSTDEAIMTAVKYRAGNDPSRHAWILYKDREPIAAFWNAVDMSAFSNVSNDPWLRGNRTGCELLMNELNGLGSGSTPSRYRCVELRWKDGK